MPELNTLFYLAVLLLCGLAFGRLAKLVRLPNVTGYLIAGLLLGPSVLGVLPAETVSSFSVISEIALSLIAFSIGCEFKISYFKRVGLTPVVIAVCEAMVAVFLVQGALIAAGQDLAFSIVLGSIAAATAPAATIMVVKQYRARGPVTETLLSVVALDDAVALAAFSFSVTIAGAITGHAASEGASLLLSILKPFGEILLALALGSAIGLLFLIPLRFFKKRGNRLIALAGLVFLSSSLASLLNVSDLLACMMTGAVFCNVSSESDEISQIVDDVTPPIYLLFFAVSGAQLDLSVVPTIGLCGILYVVVRVVGKMGGAWLGAKIMHAPKTVARYLGPTLIPQAGVAIGLTLVAQRVVPEYAQTIRAVILCATLIYEIIGPVVTKFTLKRAGEIVEEEGKAKPRAPQSA